MDTDAHGSGFICVHPCSSVVILLSALTSPLITVGSSAWFAEFGVYEPFDAEQGAAANQAFAFQLGHESQVCSASGDAGSLSLVVRRRPARLGVLRASVSLWL